MTTNPLTVKLVLLGDSRVGKSSVVIRFVKNEFDQYKFPTIGATFLTQSVSVNDYLVKFEIWDTAGQEKYRSLAPLYYRGASAALVVYDITNRESFENARKWIEEVQTQEGNHVVIGLAGNKVDLAANRKVSTDEGAEFAKEKNFIFFETSAKNSTNIKEIFKAIAQEVPSRAQPRKKDKDLLVDEPAPSNRNNDGCKCLLL
mmetsp:Transcript_8989/g.14680  ORF Transcript_8989/g.14680 Transcript_8989/m.14680 type:complete len:202 (-) Transcript_8989:446-1051(-)|eukprot:CAMPEP_0197072342 /NCGR_PEP_ID=MMETSP1384-20130603/210048_1 /TAXON_ID=29189 /ORGANISM="Ammonia sp." /LENGTH=201 /DNA_ID=CAMNT_0042511159 /DNA_START=42 /DNA_END=647 /DNA_ORIENTATION=-